MSRNGPFEALQEMYLFDPMTGLPRPEANPKLVQIAIQVRSEKEMKLKLDNMKILNKSPNWKNCLHVEFENGNDEIAMNMLAGCLVHRCLQPLELAKFNNCIWVRTN